MLHYCKMILEKMTIDTSLFKKELKKAYKMLTPEESIELYNWGKKRFPNLVTIHPNQLILVS
ncbi:MULTISPECIES: hypothetical protein [unclassified Lentimicrobium]|uniref:hypothetical protein n=1 Tax=unclassified Lentimicrobium TaxID=2677434 RepID=UPI0015543627|nr:MULTISPECIES: hypothetical protein [unclassified Lentimicrobium]NPD44931.1 hypothetical protein [Lentimicrobium sp. S6]NPD85874.1 hypothetical protein [Lentimicrobium sp. L6]